MPVHNLAQYQKYSGMKPARFTEDYLKQIHRSFMDFTGENREIKFKQLAFNQDFRNAHPTPEHLWPLHFVVG